MINSNGRELKSICSLNKLRPINHLQMEDMNCDGRLTFRKRDNWISQLDLAICSTNAMIHVKSFNIMDDIALPTYHAALALTVNNFNYTAHHTLARARKLNERSDN